MIRNKILETANIDYEEPFLDPVSETRKERQRVNLNDTLI